MKRHWTTPCALALVAVVVGPGSSCTGAASMLGDAGLMVKDGGLTRQDGGLLAPDAATLDASTAPDAGITDAGPLPRWRAAMPSRTWAKIGTDLFAIDPARDATLNPNFPAEAPWRGVGGFSNILGAWSGGAYNRDTDTLRLFGGGHADYAGNELVDIALYTEAPAWRLERAPTGAIGNTGDLKAGEASNVYFDGRPRSSHTYNQLVWAGSSFYALQGSMYESGNAGNRLFKYDSDWTDMGVNPFAAFNQFGAICYDPLRHTLNSLGNLNAAPMVSYDLTTGAWAGSTGMGNHSVTGGTTRLVYVPSLDVIVTLYGGGFAVYDYGRSLPLSNRGWPQPPTSGTPPDETAISKTGEWVPEYGVNGAIIQWNGGTGFDVLTPPAANPTTDTWVWSRIEAAAENTVIPDDPNGNGVFGRFFYSPRLHVLGFVSGSQVNVFAL